MVHCMERVYELLKKNWQLDAKTTAEEIKKALTDSKAFEFLIIWSVFETKRFNKFCRYSEIVTANWGVELKDIEANIKYFHKRYQEKECYNNLVHQDKCPEIKTIVEKEYETLSDIDKTRFVLYVIYRYRNNIFHGNKGTVSWKRFEEQIQKCVDIMIFFIEQDFTKTNTAISNQSQENETNI